MVVVEKTYRRAHGVLRGILTSVLLGSSILALFFASEGALGFSGGHESSIAHADAAGTGTWNPDGTYTPGDGGSGGGSSGCGSDGGGTGY